MHARKFRVSVGCDTIGRRTIEKSARVRAG